MSLAKNREKLEELEKDRPRLNFEFQADPDEKFPKKDPVESILEMLRKKTSSKKKVNNLTAKMAYFLSTKDKKSSKKIIRFLNWITIFPLTIAIIIVSVVTYFTLTFYFNQMMANSANIILQELKEIQQNMLSNAKNYISESYEPRLEELILLRNFIIDARNPQNKVTESLQEKITQEKINCWKSSDMDYKSLPFCIDSTNMEDYSKSTDAYRQLIAKTPGIFNANRVVNRDFSVFKQWAKSVPRETSVILSSFTLMRSFKDNNPAKFDPNDEITYVAHSNEGIFVRNFFNYRGPGTYSKISKSDCKFGLHTDIQNDMIYFDPRCRTWFSGVIEFLAKYSTEFKQEKLNINNTDYPLMTSDPYEQLDDTKKITVCTFDQYDSKKVLTKLDAFVICKDIFANQMIEFMSQSYATMMVQYLDFLKYDAKVKTLLQDYEKTVKEIKDGVYKGNFPFTNWCKKLKEYSKDMGWFALYLDKNLKYKILVDVDGFYLTPQDGKYKKFEQILSSIKFINTVQSKITITNTIGSGKEAISIIITSIGYQRTSDTKWIEWIKVAFLLPEGNMSEWAVNQTKEARSSIVTSSIVAGLIIIIVLIFSWYVMWKFAESISKQLSKIIYAAEMIKRKVPFSKDSIKLWETYEISNLYVSFLQLDKLINSVFEYSDMTQDTDAAIKLTVSTKIFNTLGNYNLLGILYNNLGNIFYNLKDYDKAIESYDKAVDNAIALFEGKLEGHGVEISVYYEKRNRRMMNLMLAKKREIELKGFKSYSQIDEIKNLANQIFVSDRNREAYFGRQIICLCVISWACRIRKDFDGSDIALSSISKIVKSTKALTLYKDYPDFLLQQEVRYEKAMNDLAKGKIRKAIYIIVAGLKRDKLFDLGQRKKFLKALFEMVEKTKSLKVTDGMMKLHKRYLSKAPKNYIMLALDYSRSMRVGGKLENSVKAFLNIWDKYTKPEDKIAFVRFNLNIEKVFEFQAKYVNEFSKRHQIEQSYNPRDRTSLFDTIEKIVEMFESVPKFNAKKFIVMITDGDDRSSIKNMQSVLEKLRMSGITLIIAGLGVSEKSKEALEVLVRNTPAGVYVDAIKGNLDHLVQVMTCFSRFENFSFLNYEYDF